mgnify:CR=1 FL=1
MLLAILPENADTAHCVHGDRPGQQFTKRTQAVYELSVGGEENIVRCSIFNLLGENGAGLGYEMESNWVRFFKLLGERRFEVREVGSGSDCQGSLWFKDGGGKKQENCREVT